jgi:peptidoglycan hydrolase-like protein with peptidoglycan-binding domain
MTKKFDNIAEDGKEQALRRGYTVPEGAVNLSWVKSPALTPTNNIVIIDTSKATAENQDISSRRKKVAYANALGILEDENGNQIWNDEYPIISDIFDVPDNDININDYTDDSILPFMHVSRYFHIDYAGIAFASLDEYSGSEIKIIDKNGFDYVDSSGKKLYKIFLVEANNTNFPVNSRESAYRVYAFLDVDSTKELYLTYDKVELNTAGGVKNQEVGYKELINPRPYFKYVPEETDVIDQSNVDQKIYSSKPSNLKQQILGMPQPNFHGWKYYVPRKAIPDPRIFQLFKWRLACEITKPIISENTGSNLIPENLTTVKVGVVVPPGGNHFTTRANFFFYQLNESDFNFSGIKFVNPLSSENGVWNRTEQKEASYWHVDIESVSLEDLSKFDVLLWAPSAESVDVSPFLTKINYFVEFLGGTFIYETSSLTQFTNIPDITLSPSLSGSLISPIGFSLTSATVQASTQRFYDATPDDTSDSFNSFGMWQSWPPNVSEILNNYTDTGSILCSADVIAGWALDQTEKDSLSPYESIPAAHFQYFESYGTNTYRPVLEALKTFDEATPTTEYKKTVLHKRFNSGGNIFVSTSCLFEDHLFNVNGNMSSRSLQISSINDLPTSYQTNFKQSVSSQAVKAEMKLRLNTMLFSTLNKPSSVIRTGDSQNQGSNVGNSQSITIYSDWSSSWVIDASNGILSEDEKTKYDFTLLTTQPSDAEPVWQRILSRQSIKQIIKDKINKLDPETKNTVLNAFEGSNRRYFIIVTNPLVQVKTSNLLEDDIIPTAWTYAYSPKFELPTHLGSYAIRDEMVAGTGTGQGRRVYPAKSYELQTNVSYMNNSTIQGSVSAIISLTGTCKKYTKAPDQSSVRSIWVPATADRIVDVVLHWNTDGANKFENIYKQQGTYPKPVGMDTWTSANYSNSVPNNWPYPGLHGTLSVNGGDRGLTVKIAQKILNQLIFFGIISGPALREDGIYGSVTASAVRRYQVVRGAKYIDGIIDAETWSLLGYGLVGISMIPGWNVPDLNSVAANAKYYMMLHAISDDNPSTVYAKQSWESNGPGVIREGFLIKFNEQFPIYKVSIMPLTAGTATNNLEIDWLDVSPRTTLHNYNYSSGFPGRIVQKNGGDGQWIDLNIFPTVTDSIVFRAVQRGRAGWGTARFIGIRDVAVYGKKYFAGSPGHYVDEPITIPGGTSEETVSFTYSAKLTFEAGIPKTISPILGLASNNLTSGGETLSDIQWDTNSLSIYPSDVGSFFTIKFDDTSNTKNVGTKNTLTLTYNGYNNALGQEVFVNGPKIGSGLNTFYTKTKDSSVDPYARTYGWIQKDDGLKLICSSDGKPYGFPSALPSQVSTSTHFARYKLSAFNTDQTVYYGFYDVVRNEFLTNSYGEPEVSYYDYVRRGPQNIFLAVQTTYELDTNDNIPGSLDPVMRPFRWGMPIYGVTSERKSKIQIEPLSADLGPNDLWSIPIKAGTFAKTIQLRTRSEGSFIGYLKNYQGSTIKAFYSIPESKNGPWSALYGRPYVDIKAEIPTIVDDKTIKVKQYPILMVQTPTTNPTLADPWIPVFKVFRRETLSSAWTEVSLSEIEDYDASSGTIILKDNLPSNDPRLVKVDYTSDRSVYYMKTDGSTKINLNPYINKKQEWINHPIYVYITPEYVTDENNVLISESVQTRTVHIAFSPSIFTSNQTDYDPTAILIGIVYISSAADANKLAILDTRKRGGGVSSTYSNGDLANIESESESYWDIIPDKATSYQKGGFVIIRLPEALKDDFTEDQIKAIIERNITIGVRYKIEFVPDLNGEDPGYLLGSDGTILLTSDLINILWGDVL